MVLKLDRSFLMVCYVCETLGVPKMKLPHPQPFTPGMRKAPQRLKKGVSSFWAGVAATGPAAQGCAHQAAFPAACFAAIY